MLQCIYLFSVRMHVLHELNWTKLVYEPLHKFETQIISTKNIQGYDSKNTEQWSLTGALLYSVTVITTIGKRIRPLHVFLDCIFYINYNNYYSLSCHAVKRFLIRFKTQSSTDCHVACAWTSRYFDTMRNLNFKQIVLWNFCLMSLIGIISIYLKKKL